MSRFVHWRFAFVALMLLLVAGGCTVEKKEGDTSIFTFDLWIPLTMIIGGTIFAVGGFYARAMYERLAWGFMPAHPTLFLRRRVYEDIGGYDPTYQIAGDFELCLRVFLRQQIRYRYLPEALVRMPSGGISNRGWRSMLIITREMRRACLQNAVPTNVFKLSSRLPLKMLEMLSRGR